MPTASRRSTQTAGTPCSRRLNDEVGILMGRESPAHASRNGELLQLGARRGRCPAASAGATVDHAEQWSGRQQHPVRQPRIKLFEPELVHAGFAALVALAMTHQQRAAALVDVVSFSASASEIRSPPRHRIAISARIRKPCRSWPAWRITTMISSGRGGSGGYCIPLLCGARPARYPAWWLAIAGGPRRRAAPSNPLT